MINKLICGLRDKSRLAGFLFKAYEEPKQKFFSMPFPLILKCMGLLGGAFCVMLVGVIVAVTSKAYKPAIAGAILAIAFIAIAIRHSYLFTRKKYVRVFAYVARREPLKKLFGKKLSRESSTFIIFPDGSERELLLGKRKLNIGGEYAFYFGQTAGTVVPNCNVLYGLETAADAEKHLTQVQSSREQEEAQEKQDNEAAAETKEFPDEDFNALWATNSAPGVKPEPPEVSVPAGTEPPNAPAAQTESNDDGKVVSINDFRVKIDE